MRPSLGALMATLVAAQHPRELASATGAPSSFRGPDGTKYRRIRDYTARLSVEDQLRTSLQQATTQQQCQEMLLAAAAACPDVSAKTRRRWRLAVLQRIAEIDRQAREARPLIVVPA